MATEMAITQKALDRKAGMTLGELWMFCLSARRKVADDAELRVVVGLKGQCQEIKAEGLMSERTGAINYGDDR